MADSVVIGTAERGSKARQQRKTRLQRQGGEKMRRDEESGARLGEKRG
jgi:hypothetical protein